MVQTSVKRKNHLRMGGVNGGGGGGGDDDDDDRPISTYDNLLNLLPPIDQPPNNTSNSTNPIMMMTATTTTKPEGSNSIELQYHHPNNYQTEEELQANNCQPQHYRQNQHLNNTAEYHVVNEGGNNRLGFAAAADDADVTTSFRVNNNKSPDQFSTIQQPVNDAVKSTTTTTVLAKATVISTEPSLLKQQNTIEKSPPITANEIITTTATTTSVTAQSTLSNKHPDTHLTVRTFSQQIGSELNDTSQSIALVKAALNEAKSKFFGLTNYQEQQQQSMTNRDEDLDLIHIYHGDDNPNNIELEQQQQNNETVQLLPLADNHRAIIIHDGMKTVQPKYQNLPANSALFLRNPPNSTRQSDIDCNTTSATTAFTSTLNNIENMQPSQAVYMTTTVPQNIKGSKIAGRHTPTRSSLRHSRMLVINNKAFQKFPKANSMNFRHPSFARCLLILQLLIGLLLAAVAIWQFLLAPNISTQDNSYWSSITLLMTSILGLNLICYRRIKHQKFREHAFVFFRSASYLLSILAVILCAIAFIIAAIHYRRLAAPNTKCESTNILMENGSCVCFLNTIPDNETLPINNTITDVKATNDDDDDRIEYRDLSCQEVAGVWTTILYLLIIFNTLAFLVSVLFVILLLCYRHSSREIYTSVQTNAFANFT